MSNHQIIRAWKDVEYRLSLTADELAAVPENPVGVVKMADFEDPFLLSRLLTNCGGCDCLTEMV